MPLLQERGNFRTQYSGHALRDYLGLQAGRVVTGWLILLAAVLTAGRGFLLRAFISRRPDDHMLRRVVRRFRNTRLARMVFGPLDSAHGGDE